MKNKSFEEIKVSDICKEAHINRSTFYNNFNDKYDPIVKALGSKPSTIFIIS